MIKKIIELKNVGCFEHLRATSGNEGDFAKVNIVYASNACGKTTLCDVFRSVQTRNPAYVMGRKRIGGSFAIGNGGVCPHAQQSMCLISAL